MQNSLKQIYQNKENATLAFLSFFLAANSFFFISREVKALSTIPSFKDTEIHYLLFLIFSVLIFGTVLFFMEKLASWKIAFKKLLLSFLPAAMILAYGITHSTKFHYVFFMAVGVFVISAGFFLCSLRKNPWKGDSKNNFHSLKAWTKNQGKMAWIIIFSVMIANLAFGTYDLAKFGAVDEPLWTFGRIPKYWKNISEKDWNGTRISDKPGITVAIISGVGLLFEKPKTYESAYSRGLIQTESNRYDFEKLNFAFRFPIFLFTVLMLPFFYFLIERLLGKNTALFSTISIGLSPLLIGMSSIINPDSILWVFGPLALLSFLNYQKRRNPFYLYLSGIFLGLALLTKYVANILSVFFFGLIFIEYILHRATYASMSAKKYLKESIIDYIVLLFVSLAVFCILFPAVWVKPVRILNGTLLSQAFESTWPLFAGIFALILIDMISFGGKVFSLLLDFLSKYKRIFLLSVSGFFIFCIAFAFANVFAGMKWYDFEAIISSPKSAYSAGGYDGLFFANFFPLVFTLTPLVFVFLVFASASGMLKKYIAERTSSTIFSLTLFILLYYTATTVNKVAAMNRYQIMVFPLAILLGAIGMEIFYSKFIEKKYRFDKSVFAIIFILAAGTLFFSKPFFMSYDSPLLPNQYYTDLKDMGTGSYQAAQFINSLPEPEKLQVWTDKKGVCPFLKAKCYSGFTYPKLRAAELDYAIVSAGRESRTKKMIKPETIKKDLLRFDTLYEREDKGVAYKLEINGRPRNFIKVIRLDQEFFDLYKNK